MIGLGLNINSSPQSSSSVSREAAFSNTKSLSFDGTNDAARWASNSTIPGLIGAGNFSISWWIKKANFFPATSGTDPFFIQSLIFSGGVQSIYFIANGDSNNSPGRLQVLFGNASSTVFVNIITANDLRSSVADDTWHHFVLTSDAGASSRTNKLYVNGSELSYFTNNSNGVDFSSTNFGDLALGSSTFNLGSDSFHQVEYDEISMYASVLSSSDVSAIYNSGVPVDESSRVRLAGYWRLEDNGDDSSSNSNNLTVTGATFTTDVPS
tara:strand:- start:1146 stop:1946 length:801 start_codon:yes stop_codon:yes gene_type:complete